MKSIIPTYLFKRCLRRGREYLVSGIRPSCGDEFVFVREQVCGRVTEDGRGLSQNRYFKYSRVILGHPIVDKLLGVTFLAIRKKFEALADE
ncbi:hypothetical protein V6N13_039225 [Hibiscus sabdariffa]